MNRTLQISQLLEEDAADLQLELLAGFGGISRIVAGNRIQKPGLALTGFTEFVHSKRVQILGSTELTYLSTLEEGARKSAIEKFCACDLACVICTKGMKVPPLLVNECEKNDLALLATPQVTSVFISRVELWLEDRLCPRTVMHAVLVDVSGVGVLILGKSGIGKSETALELVHRGHRLVADDIVTIHRRGAETVWGQGNAILKHHIEIRGLGILNMKDLYGVAAVREKKRIDLVVELVDWSEDEEYDRLGIDERRFPILDVELTLLTVPVRPGRSLGSIIEVAVRDRILKSMGTHTAQEFQERLERELAPGRRSITDDVE
ncbi:MAG: HPr(Ser) kinase/phosphatase [Deltaproteobacteria bacterium]|nr:HPr(Ser) kinase/phosphatase [Deltaproteobacteria bacterium]